MLRIKDYFSKLSEVDWKRVAWITVGIVTVLQVILIVVYWDYPIGPDERGYVKHALDSYAIGTTYPSMLNVNDKFLQAPGLVN